MFILLQILIEILAYVVGTVLRARVRKMNETRLLASKSHCMLKEKDHVSTLLYRNYESNTVGAQRRQKWIHKLFANN